VFNYLILSLALPVLALPCAAMACDADLGGQFQTSLSTKAPDQALFSEAVTRLVNQERCTRGLRGMKTSTSLTQVALGHSKDMVAKNFFSHQSPTRGRKTMKLRLDKSGVRYRRAAENIAQLSVYAFAGQRFVIKSAAKCHFESSSSGAPIPRHSYASLARASMQGWMNSTGHRRNILDPKLSSVGTAVAIKRNAPHCGHTLITQNFSGE